MKKLLCVCASLVAATVTYGAIHGEEIRYSADGINMKGYIAWDDAIPGPRPGVLVVHEWWGQNAFARERARKLAELGYTALAVDMYGEGKEAGHPKEAGAFATEVKSKVDRGRARFQAAMDVLRAHETTDPDRLAAIGYCFGGGIVLQMARDGLDLDCVVSFHGSLDTDHPAQVDRVKARILVCHGSEDAFTSPETLAKFKREMDAARVEYKVVVYEGAKHSFTNPKADELAAEYGLPLGYDADAAEASWEDMQGWLRGCFPN